MNHCSECGMVLHDQGEYHPYEFCLLKKAGLDPWDVLRRMNGDLGDDVSRWPKHPPTVRHIREHIHG